MVTTLATNWIKNKLEPIFTSIARRTCWPKQRNTNIAGDSHYSKPMPLCRRFFLLLALKGVNRNVLINYVSRRSRTRQLTELTMQSIANSEIAFSNATRSRDARSHCKCELEMFYFECYTIGNVMWNWFTHIFPVFISSFRLPEDSATEHAIICCRTLINTQQDIILREKK